MRQAAEEFIARIADKIFCVGQDWAQMMRLRRGLIRHGRQATARALEVLRRPAPQEGQAAWTQILAVLLLERLREFLTVVIERNAVPLELQQRGYGILTSIIADRSLFQDSRFVLTAVASIPAETLRSQLPTQMKIGSVEQIRDLVNLQLPGVDVNLDGRAEREGFAAGGRGFLFAV